MPVLDIDQVRGHLNLVREDAETEAAVRAIITAAEAAIAARCGDLEPTQRVEVHTVGRGGALPLRAPLVSVTSITPVTGGAPVTVQAHQVDATAGLVHGLPAGTYAVAYVSGREHCPPDLLMGVKELVAHLWATTKRSAGDRGRQAAEAPGAAYLYPYRVEAWIAPYLQPGIA